MNCDDALPLIYDLVDNDLNDADRAALEQHLCGCQHCRAQLASIRAAELIYQRELSPQTATMPARDRVEQITDAVLPAPLDRASSIAPMAMPIWLRVARLSAIAAGLAAIAYLLTWLPNTSEFTLSAIHLSGNIVTGFNPQNWSWDAKESARIIAQLHLENLPAQWLTSIKDSMAAISAALPTSNVGSIAITLLIATQIIVTYRLIGGGEPLHQDKKSSTN